MQKGTALAAEDEGRRGKYDLTSRKELLKALVQSYML